MEHPALSSHRWSEELPRVDCYAVHKVLDFQSFQQFIMNLVNLLTLLVQTQTKDDRRVLRDSPGCGQIGKESNKECFWGCDWLPVSPIKDITSEDVLQKLQGHFVDQGRF